MVDVFSTTPWPRSDRRPPYRLRQWPQRCLARGAQVNHGRRRLIAALVAVWNKARKSEASTGIMRQGSEPTPVKTVWPRHIEQSSCTPCLQAEPSAALSDIHHTAREPRWFDSWIREHVAGIFCQRDCRPWTYPRTPATGARLRLVCHQRRPGPWHRTGRVAMWARELLH